MLKVSYVVVYLSQILHNIQNRNDCYCNYQAYYNRGLEKSKEISALSGKERFLYFKQLSQ